MTLSVLLAFTLSSVAPVHAQSWPDLPQPGEMVPLSAPYRPLTIQGIKVNRDDPLRFDFLIDGGDANLSSDEVTARSRRLVKFFMAALTTPAKDLWVNLSPYEKERIIPEELGLTDMGRVLLEQDYILKQMVSTLLHPDDVYGKAFWDKVYAQAQARFGTTDVPTDTFHKVWIVPEKARVFEDGSSNTVLIVDRHLKVMLEEDYAATASSKTVIPGGNRPADAGMGEISSRIMREVIVPALEREVNEGARFAVLRQVYDALILAVWYKQALKESALSRGYADRNKTVGIRGDDPRIKEEVYARYLRTVREGVYSFIRDDVDRYSGELIPRKYFSGGFDGQALRIDRSVSRDEAAAIASSMKAWAVNAALQLIRPAGRGIAVALIASTLVGCAAVNPQGSSLARDLVAPSISSVLIEQRQRAEPAQGQRRAEAAIRKISSKGLVDVPGSGSASGGKVLVLVPGAQGSVLDFKYFLNDPRYYDGFMIKVFNYDHKDPIAAASLFGGQLHGLIATYGTGQVGIMGHSLGTRVALIGMPAGDEVPFVALAPLTQGQYWANMVGPVAEKVMRVIAHSWHAMVMALSHQLPLQQEVDGKLRYLMGSCKYFSVGAEGDRHITSAGMGELDRMAGEGRGVLLSSVPEGKDPHMYILEHPTTREEILGWFGKAGPGLSKRTLAVDDGDRTDPAMAPYGGIDLEKTSVKAERRGAGVSLLPRSLERAVAGAPGLSVRILSARTLTPAEAGAFLGAAPAASAAIQ